LIAIQVTWMQSRAGTPSDLVIMSSILLWLPQRCYQETAGPIRKLH
jgi:hypothetical protein